MTITFIVYYPQVHLNAEAGKLGHGANIFLPNTTKKKVPLKTVIPCPCLSVSIYLQRITPSPCFYRSVLS